MNDRSYWEKLGEEYDEEVFDVFANDKGRVIASRIEAVAKRESRAADFGCGVGKFLPLMSSRFGSVQAVDFSQSCLRRGAERYRELGNVSFTRFDMCRSTRAFRSVEFVLSVNALLTPDLGRQLAMFQTLARHLVKGGQLVLVVPALESALFAADRLLQWNLRSGLSARKAVNATSGSARKEELNFGPHGVVEISGAATKHYLREELIDRLAAAGFQVAAVEKVEYGWATEFESPPRWMGAPFPWDWCVTAERR
jgi:SAM-dependent methyltransferase